MLNILCKCMWNNVSDIMMHITNLNFWPLISHGNLQTPRWTNFEVHAMPVDGILSRPGDVDTNARNMWVRQLSNLSRLIAKKWLSGSRNQNGQVVTQHLVSYNAACVANTCGSHDQSFRSNMIACRADSRFAPSQWQTALLCNDVFHWLGANLKSGLACRAGLMACNS